MIALAEFIPLVRVAIPRFQDYPPNPQQVECILAVPTTPLMIVAGPGTGKTTVLALRVLKLILVDGFRPERIMATTFTRKAAAELRSRILSWGYSVISRAIKSAEEEGNHADTSCFKSLDINRVITGTLDALAEQFLRDHRPTGEITPATIERFLARGLLLRHGLFAGQRHNNSDLGAHLNSLRPHYPRAYGMAEKLDTVIEFADRVRHDGIDLQAYRALDTGHAVLCDVVTDYFQHLEDSHLADFARAEQLFLEGLRIGSLQPVADSLDALLVDEFQDTNFLQEQIYLELCRRGDTGLTVVGDDDQSIYRFRGATVEIFAHFAERIVDQLGANWRPLRLDLRDNYRATERAVEFCNSFIQTDPLFQSARISDKKRIIATANHAHAPTSNLPVLGMFRQDVDTLARNLSAFLVTVLGGAGHMIHCNGIDFEVVCSAEGNYGDAVLLGGKTTEYRQAGAPRLPLLLRQYLGQHDVRVFNPRGRSLSEILAIQRLLGLALLCIDPQSLVLNNISSISQSTRTAMAHWRQTGDQFAASDPVPGGLGAFLQGWRDRTPGPEFSRWPQEWPFLELIFTLVTWIPELQQDPEGQVYLEAIARTVAEAGQLTRYNAAVVHGKGTHDERSVRELIRGVFEPIAEEMIDVDEEIMPHIPRGYFPMMTIHQAKGLEFPLVIVDVGSDYKTNHHTQRRFRFPDGGDGVHAVEDAVASYCPVGDLRAQRPARERAWDDLRRLYYVAYSRTQDVLLLVGLISQIRQDRRVPSIATGDLQDMRRVITFVPAPQWSPDMSPSTVALI